MIVVGVIVGIIAITTVGGWIVAGIALNRGPDALGDSAPSWSEDGTKVAFSSDETGDLDIYVMNADGTERINLTKRDAKDIDPAWSPTGEWIAFLSRTRGQTDIHRVRPDGSGLSTLTSFPAQEYSRPIWSPDGTKIAFTSNRDAEPPPQLGPIPVPYFTDTPEFPGAAPRPELYVMNADGTGQTRLTFNFFFDGNPTWSPDSEKIAFQSRTDGDHEIYVVNVDGTGLTKLTDNDYADIFPAWSPDGRYIAFSSNRPKTEFGREMSEAARRVSVIPTSAPVDFDIYIMEQDGNRTYNWTRTSSLWDSGPSWSPDGSWIAFEARPHLMFTQRGAARDIYVMRFEGADLTNITGAMARNQEGNEGPIVWSPDGSQLAFVTQRYGTPQVQTVQIFNSS
jgi:TolB protein